MPVFSDLRKKLSSRSALPDSHDERAATLWRELEASEQFLLAEIDPTGLIRRANPPLRNLRDERSALVGASLLYLTKADDRDAIAQLVRSAFASGTKESVVVRFLGDGETRIPVRWTVLPFRLSDEQVAATALCVGTVLDPSPAKLFPAEPSDPAELERLRQSNVQFEEELQSLRQELAERANASPDPTELERLRQSHSQLEEELQSMRQQLAERSSASPAAEKSGTNPQLELPDPASGRPPTLAQWERRYINHTLEVTNGRISGAKGAAALLGLHPNTLRSRMERLNIQRVA